MVLYYSSMLAVHCKMLLSWRCVRGTGTITETLSCRSSVALAPSPHIYYTSLKETEMFESLLVCYSYHQKVAYDPPILELKATYGLAAPEPFTPPALNPLWSKEVYEKMNAKMAPKPTEVTREIKR